MWVVVYALAGLRGGFRRLAVGKGRIRWEVDFREVAAI